VRESEKVFEESRETFFKKFLLRVQGGAMRKTFACETNLAGLLALHPANIFAPPKILDKKAAQGHRPCVSHQGGGTESAIRLCDPSPWNLPLLTFCFLGEVTCGLEAVKSCRTEQAVARGAKGGVDGRGDPLSRLTAPALPKGEPTKDILIIKASPFGRGGTRERDGEG